MSLHINRFVDRIKATEAKRQRDLVMPISEARDLHAEITKLLLALQQVNEQPRGNNDVIDISVQGGTF